MTARRSVLGAALAATIAGRSYGGRAQAMRPLLGFVYGGSAASAAPLVAALRAGLAERGYAEPATLAMMLRFAEGRPDRFPVLMREFAAANVNVIVASGIVGARVAKEMTPSIPVVIAGAIDVVGAGLVDSLAHPGGNITGLSQQRLDTSPKEVELLAELVPGLVRLAVLRAAVAADSGAVGVQAFDVARKAAASRNIAARSYEIAGADDIDTVFAAIAAAGDQAVIVLDAPLLSIHRERIVAAGLAARLPLLASSREYVDAGALVSHGASLPVIYRRTAHFVDRILKGAKPAELPIEQPTTFELTINLRTAKTLGLTVSPLLLTRADEVIE